MALFYLVLLQIFVSLSCETQKINLLGGSISGLLFLYPFHNLAKFYFVNTTNGKRIFCYIVFFPFIL